MSGFPVRIESWQTSDHRLHNSEWAATKHQECIDSSIAVTKALAAGATLDAALIEFAGGWRAASAEDHEIAAHITWLSLFTISHWQCSDVAGYRVHSMGTDGTFWVYGDVGSWTGPWGSHTSLPDLLRYARNTMDRNGGVLPVAEVSP